MDYLNPKEYFDAVKERKHIITDTQLESVYENCLELIAKYRITGQKKAIQKLMFHLDCIEKEREIVKLGINTFVYRDDIEYYINNVADDIVKIIDLESYEREIPDEIVEVIERVKDKFDQLYIVFTDYTGDTEREVQEERREKDPILFGTFQNEQNRSIIDRFYYLGDWADEYCDLTLDKLVNETERVGNRKITHPISTPEDLAELKKQLDTLNPSNITTIPFKVAEIEPKTGFFTKVKTFFHKKA